MIETENPPAAQNLDFQTGTEVPDICKKPFPAMERTEPRVSIDKSVFDAIVAHGRENTSVEICGILVGKLGKDDAGPYLIIDNCIRGKYARNNGTQVTFTHETWEYIHSEMESKFKDHTIVGWYHTHPGFGIFLSDMDKFIHDYFFNQPFQVALVIDPIASKEGLFTWIEGKIRPLSRCWIGNELHRLTLGTVGSAENQDPPNSTSVADNLIQSKSERPRYASGEGVVDNTNKYILSFCIIAAFVLGALSTFFALRGTLITAALTAARAETREILSLWATDTVANDELNILKSRLKSLAGYSGEFINADGSWKISGASYGAELDDICRILESVASSSAERRTRIQKILAELPTKAVSLEEALAQIQEQLAKMRAILAETLLIQYTPYFKELAEGKLDSYQAEYLNRIAKVIVELNPQCEAALRKLVPHLDIRMRGN